MAAEAKAADDKLWIFTKKWFNLRFVLQYHKQGLYAFAAAGLIEIGARGSSYGKRSLELTVKNLASCPLKVLVPRGSWFHNRTPFYQPLVTIRDCWIEIEPGALATVELDTFCGSVTYGCPRRDDMELSPYVFDGDDVMMSQSKVWAYFYPYVPAIPKEHQPSNPAASTSPNPQLDEEAAKAVVEDVRDEEHRVAVAQVEALRAEAARVAALEEAAQAEAARVAAEEAAQAEAARAAAAEEAAQAEAARAAAEAAAQAEAVVVQQQPTAARKVGGIRNRTSSFRFPRHRSLAIDRLVRRYDW